MPATKARTPKWRRRPEHRPQQIIQAALEEFGKCGLANARLQDIAKRAGVSKGTIYLYFPNKEELFKAMVRDTAVVAIKQGEHDLIEGTATERLHIYMRRYWQFVRTPAFSTLYRLVIGELHQFPDLAQFYAREVVARALKLLTGILDAGIQSGEFRQMEPVPAGRMLIALIIMHAIWSDQSTGVPLLLNESDEEVFQDLARFYLHSIAPSPGACAQADGAPLDAVPFIPSIK
jgi:AcrR family transcriptional regulator